jgi:HK97 family phage major capsid protein
MRIKEIEKRLAEIRAEIETGGDTLTEERIAALDKEVTDLQEERKKITAAQEKRGQILQSIAAGAGEVQRTFTPPSPTPAAAPANEQRQAEDKTNTVEYRRAFMGYVMRGTPIPMELRTDAVTTTTDAGAVIPNVILDKIIEKMENVGMILPLVTKTAYKGGVSIPTSSAKPTATWVNEGATSDKQKKTVAKDAMITFAYYKLRCAVAVTLEMDTMALSAFEAMLITNITEAMVKALEQAIISGTGSGQPKGIITETPASGQTVEVSAVAYENLINAEAALPQKYEANAVWCMSKKSFMAYIGITDANGQPIARVNYGIAGRPERFLLGRPVICNDYLSSYATTLAANTVFGFLFDFSDYMLNTNFAMTIKKYEDNDTDDKITKAIMLVDGKVLDKNSLVVLKKVAA